MTAINHALTGAFIGLTISEPAIALPVAFASHFVLDAIPHYDVSEESEKERIDSKKFFILQIVAGAALCFLLVLLLALARPRHWIVAAICAFLATSPDLFWIKKYLVIKKSNKLLPNKNWFWHFHGLIQWFQRPIGAVVEITWLVSMLVLVGVLV